MNLRVMLPGKPVDGHGGPLNAASPVVKWVELALPFTLAALLSFDRCSDAFFMMELQAASVATTPAAAAPNAFSMDELERLSGGRTAAGDIPLDLEWVYQFAAQPDDVRAVIERARIETVGQIVRDPADPTQWRLSRLLTTCCAADARAVSVALTYEGDPSQWQALGWYRTVGRIVLDGSRMPVFKVESVAPVEPPHQRIIH